ncbi:hypothetical protein vBSenS3_104 [Salmonella phage vB_SenS-3]|nr:hypothetical protein vBSenS3_104 [Salmonella phage vB_SenS-3]
MAARLRTLTKFGSVVELAIHTMLKTWRLND